MRVVVPLEIAVDPTVKAEAGVAAQVPSPRQKVDDDALVPLLRLATGRLPVICDARLMEAVVHTTCVPPELAVQK